MADKKDYYEMLGVPRDASVDDIRSSYRRLAKQYHPDVTKEDSAHAEERFKEISEAYEVLLDPEKRKLYDDYGRAGVAGHFSEEDKFSWQDFSHRQDLNDIFGGRSGMGQDDLFEFFGGGQRRGPSPGQNLRMDIEISLEEAARGVKREVVAPLSTKCDQCQGKGSRDGKSRKCRTCAGKGQVQRVHRKGGAQYVSVGVCAKCGGKGRSVDHPCPKCNAAGYVHRPQKIEVSIPKGVDTGMQLRVPGAGEKSPDGGPPGSLFIVIHVRDHPIFKREGPNLLTERDISFADAALGGEIAVPTLFGSVRLTLPEGTQTGTEFRLRGAGLDRPDSSGKGDMVVRVRLKVPKNLSGEQKEQLRRFNGLSQEKVLVP
jgi:molecular chaperone DnaJ